VTSAASGVPRYYYSVEVLTMAVSCAPHDTAELGVGATEMARGVSDLAVQSKNESAFPSVEMYCTVRSNFDTFDVSLDLRPLALHVSA
jgi:hypothetical protein